VRRNAELVTFVKICEDFYYFKEKSILLLEGVIFAYSAYFNGY
jgi:hypothetical protein